MPRFLGLGRGTGILDLSSYTPILASCSGSSGSKSLSATGSFVAGQRIFIIQMTGTGAGTNFEDNYVVSYSAGTITTLYSLEFTYTDSGTSQAQVVVVPEAASITGSINVDAWDGNINGIFVAACSGQFNGQVYGAGKGFRGGAGHKRSDGVIGVQGESYNGVGTSSNAANDGAGGGAGVLAITSGNGGGGSYGTLGDDGYGGGLVGGTKGSTYGIQTLVELFMGSGGGGAFDNGNVATGGNGGPGGALARIYAGYIGSTAIINVDGEIGSTSTYNGGSGTGGSISGKARGISPSAILSALGGISNTTGQTTGGGGGKGGDGRIALDICSGEITTNPAAYFQRGGFSYCSSSISGLLL